MSERDYDALLLDLDGTLLTSDDALLPENVEALHAAREQGVRVMVVTGRSMDSSLPVLEQLGLEDTRAVLFNGAAVYCPREDRLIEERTLSNRAVEDLRAYAGETGDLALVMSAERRLVGAPQDANLRMLAGLQGLEFVDLQEAALEHVIRVTFLAERLPTSHAYALEVEEAVRHPLYLTHYPLSVLPMHRESRAHAVDAHAPCRGKAEALRVLEETYGIPRSRVVAVGDATNDAPMVEQAGLGVAMGSGMRELREVADRVIGGNDSGAIAGLVGELFL